MGIGRAGAGENQDAGAIPRVDDDPVDVGRDDLAGSFVPAAPANLAQQRHPLGRPTPERGFVDALCLTLGRAELLLQMLLPLPELGQPGVHHGQVGRVKTGDQRVRGRLNLGKFAAQGPDIDQAPSLLPYAADKSIDRVRDAVVIGVKNLLELGEHPSFERIRTHVRWHRADGLPAASATRADVVRGHDVLAARDAPLALVDPPERLTAAGAPEHAAQEPPPGLLAPSTGARGAIGGGHLRAIPRGAIDDRGHGPFEHDPIVRVRLGDAPGAKRRLHPIRSPLLHLEELGLGASVPYEVAAIGRVLDERLHRGELPQSAPGADRTPAVEFGGDAFEADPVDAQAEDRADDLDTRGIAEHQPRRAVLARLMQGLALAVHRLHAAAAITHFAITALQEADAIEHGAIGTDHLAVVPVGRHPAGIGSPQDGRELTPQGDLRERDAELPILELFDGAEHVAINAVAGQIVLGHGVDRDPGVAEEEAVVLGFGDIPS